jgi:hypothetical protein
MVIEAFHAGRSVPCPWCGAGNDVPREIDFATIAHSQSKDERRGGWLMVFACVAFVTYCLPVSAWVWWDAHGRMGRAADEGRPPDGMVTAAKWVAMIACVVQTLYLTVLLLTRL